MTRKRRRLYALGLFMLGLGTATALALVAFQDNLVFFYSPSDIAARKAPAERTFRIGGLVETGSVVKAQDGKEVRFRVTDNAHVVPVVYAGVLPDLFREGQGVVAQGRLTPDGQFRASEVLAKHDENYMPPEVADALKKSGHWQPGEAPK
jgi:cytochrome c-type biogenesis protein CcmE